MLLLRRRRLPVTGHGLALAGRAALAYVDGMRWRTPIGGLVLVLGIAAYAVAAVTLAGVLPDNRLVEAVFYLVAGVAWVPAALKVLAWARRDDDGSG